MSIGEHTQSIHLAFWLFQPHLLKRIRSPLEHVPHLCIIYSEFWYRWPPGPMACSSQWTSRVLVRSLVVDWFFLPFGNCLLVSGGTDRQCTESPQNLGIAPAICWWWLQCLISCRFLKNANFLFYLQKRCAFLYFL